MKMTLPRQLWLLAWIAMGTSAVFAAALPTRHIAVSARVEPAVARAGETVKLVITAVVDEGWHLYSLTQKPGGPEKTTITLAESAVVGKAGAFTGPEPKRVRDTAFDMDVEQHEGKMEFTAPLALKVDAAVGKQKIEGKMRFMLCNEQSCLPPMTAPFAAEFTIEPGAPRAEFVAAVSTAPAVEAKGAPEKFGGQADGLGGLILLAIISGLVSLLTPCVFPMIPITVSFFTKEASHDRRRALQLAVVYGLGIIATFTLVGVVLTLLLGAGSANKFAASPLVNIGIGLLFVAFALSLFGLFEIQLPSSWIDAAQSRAGAGTVGAMFMALVFTLTSFTCTAPFIGPLLVAITQGAWFWPLVGMGVFSATFAAPFVLLALFPSWIARLPRSGGWLNSTKVVMGFLELAAAMKFFSNADLIWQWDVFTTPVVLASWIVLAMLTGLYILGKLRMPHEEPVEGVGGVRVMFSLVFFVLALVMTPGMVRIPPPNLIDSYLPTPVALKQQEKLTWSDDYAAALKQAKAEGKNVFIDFTGYTCTNCRWMEISMFPQPEVEAALQKFVRVRLYTDGGPRGQENQDFQIARFGDAALPLYVVMSADDKEIARFAGMTRDVKAYLEFLKKGL
ncbi:MAG: thioredoxin family protein [Verrucomicrobia bacterium]|nr:thioredoxin family protein [Verrucomicrobiota bacterium]